MIRYITLIVLILFNLSNYTYAQCKICSGPGLKNEKYAKNEILNQIKKEKSKDTSDILAYPAPPKEKSKSIIKGINKEKNKIVHILEGGRYNKDYKRKHRKKISRRTKYFKPIELYPEKTIWIKLSNRDLNRLVCQKGPITYLMTSNEKGVTVKIKDNEAYIKFKVFIRGRKIIYHTSPTEFYVRCGGKTYSFISRPQNIPTRTIYLVSKTDKVKPDEEILKKNRLDEVIVDIIRKVFLGHIDPSWEKISYKRINITKSVLNYRINIKEISDYAIPGVPVIIRVFNMKTNKKIQLNEKILLDSSITSNPIAISILDHTLYPKLKTRAVILEKSSKYLNW